MYFKYEVVYYDDVCKKNRNAAGLVFAEDYGDATKYIEDYYDGAFISSIKIEATDHDCPIYETKDEEI